ncbi:RusA family crossover junction endodeoxyribonuclease [Nocardioides sp. PD653]|uniref:RusA family crossover junction endodeoxyribonuclease n=1 Tax=Nocardioides sp. PD653 TaxID=393303 RepID=UPI0013FE23E3|nr:RusA family crossover junction endodeoxyribonuclease [Nocardioides sp. PD653]
MDATRSQLDILRATGLVVATGALDHDVYAFRVEGEPIAKSRVRVEKSRRYAVGRTDDAELDIANAVRRGSGPGDRFAGNVAVAAVFYRSNRHRVDVDNLLKTVLDGITKSGLVWADDDQVTAVLGVIEHDPAHPRIAVAVANHESTMLRGDARRTRTCETCGVAFQPHSDRQRGRYCSLACRPRRVQICTACGGPTSAPHVVRCLPCHNSNQRGTR